MVTPLWPVETLTADPAVVLPYVLHVPRGVPGPLALLAGPREQPERPGSGSSTVDLGGSHYALAVCLGAVEETGGARRSVAEQIGPDDLLGEMVVWNRNATLVAAPYGELVRVDRAYAEAGPPRLTDWLVDHGGYTYAVGYLHPDDDTTRYRDVEAMIASVTWDQ